METYTSPEAMTAEVRGMADENLVFSFGIVCALNSNSVVGLMRRQTMADEILRRLGHGRES